MADLRTIFLYGAPASGKSTLGRRLATALKTSFVDLDETIAERAGRSIPAIFAAEGEEGFRNRESAALSAVVASSAGAVVALGGGTLLREENRALCEQAGWVWCLETPSADELARRLALAAGSRPLGDKAQTRAPHYASFGHRVAASFEAGDSLVVVGSSLAAAVLPRFPVVADATVASLTDWLAPFATVPSGEEHKTVQTVVGLWSAFAARGLGRRDVVCACGGGVTGDLTGFAAATWMRGIDWVNVPTTLLAMVDASTGGKTGCDLAEGKNLAGAFHAPRLVVIDTDFLKTLPPARLADGWAEMIKHAAIAGRTAAGVASAEPRAGAIPSAAAIASNLTVKVGIVREDPLETKGRRLLLNCGHTVAHAVERLTNYAVSHGEAVAIGCVEEARQAVRMGLAQASWPQELAAEFAAAGLPTDLPSGLDFATLAPTMRGDKKRAGDAVTFALPCGWGDVRAVPIDLAAVRRISPGPRTGAVTVPPSKSHAHRLLIANFLAGERNGLELQQGDNEDVAATKRCLRALSLDDSQPILDCGESGSTLRFLAPVAAALGKHPRFVRRGRLAERPFREYATLEPGVHELAGDVSSQFVTGLLFALPLLQGDSEIRFTSPLESRGYVEMTLRVLRQAGIVVRETECGFSVPGGQRYRPQATAAEGDWSGAAFWYGMNALGSAIAIGGIAEDSLQPDRAIAELCAKLPRTIDVADYPDLFPVLAVVAAGTPQTTVFSGLARLRLKECDRVEAMREMLDRLGVVAQLTGEGASARLTVEGTAARFRTCFLRTFGDHRIAMAAAVAATRAEGPVVIDNASCADKSYPGFFAAFESLSALI